MHHHTVLFRFVTIISFVVALNVIFLDLVVLKKIQPKNTQIQSQQSDQISLPNQAQSSTPDTCSQSCLETIKEATASEKFVTLPTSSISAKNNTSASISATSTIKEFFIPLGAGSSVAEEWADVGGAQAMIDTANYGKITKALFEVSLHIPTGNEYAYVRLYNATDNLPVSFSEVYYPGSSDQLFLTSQPLVLTSGNKLYKVQMKTQLKYPAILDQSRIHITTH